MKALKLALNLLPLAALMGGVTACGSAGGSSANEGEQTSSISTPIVGGHLDTTTQGVVALVKAAHGQFSVNCSGSLLAPNLVLTARHCVSQIGDGTSTQVDCDTSEFTAKYNPRLLFVSTDAQPTADSTLYPVKEVREAPGSIEVCGFDLALLILSSDGIPKNVAEPIEPVLDHPPRAKQAFAAVGYGLQDPTDQESSGTRMRFDSSSVSCIGSKCALSYEAKEDEWVGKSPVCPGDSGGPALDSDGRVFGVTSRGDKECTFAVYSNVADWADFVRSTAVAAAAYGKYSPPSWTVEPSSGAGGSGSTGSSSSSGGSAPAAAAGAVGTAGSLGAAGSISPPSGPVGTTVDPLGSSCNGDCPQGYRCYTATSTPPGICVPECSAEASSCPARYTCSESLGACTPTQPTVKTAHVSASCALSPGAQPTRGASTIAALLGLTVLWLGRRRRPLP